MDSHLPDNFDAWPDSPFELLGLPEDATLRDAKRAFAKLIRIYKADSHPKEFQRIRDAFEFCRRWLEMDGPAIFATTAENFGEDNGPNDTPTAENTPAPEIRPELAAADELIQSGDLETAYHRLCQQPKKDNDVFRRLYWVAFLQPDLTDKSPRQWLEAATTGPAGDWLDEAWTWEMRYRPIDPAFPECLADRLESDGWPILNLFRERWSGLVRKEQTKTVLEDLKILKQRSDLTPRSMTEVRLAIAPYLCCLPPDDISLTDFAKQIEGEIENSLDRADELDRIEYLCELQLELKGARFLDVPSPWSRLVQLHLTQPHEFCRQPLQTFMAEILVDPKAFVTKLDSLQSGFPIGISELIDLARNALMWDTNVPDDDEGRERVISRFLNVYSALPNYTQLRSHLLDFCMDELIDPLTVAGHADAGPNAPSWVLDVRQDPALRIAGIAAMVLG